MSVQNDSNDSIFFHLVWRRSVFFSFYKLRSYPFFNYLLSGANWLTSFFIYLFYFIRPRPFIYVFSLSSSSILCLCLHVLCLMPIVHFVSVSVFTICLVFVRLFFLLLSSVSFFSFYGCC
jgi:hypothetical protein